VTHLDVDDSVLDDDRQRADTGHDPDEKDKPDGSVESGARR